MSGSLDPEADHSVPTLIMQEPSSSRKYASMDVSETSGQPSPAQPACSTGHTANSGVRASCTPTKSFKSMWGRLTSSTTPTKDQLRGSAPDILSPMQPQGESTADGVVRITKLSRSVSCQAPACARALSFMMDSKDPKTSRILAANPHARNVVSCDANNGVPGEDTGESDGPDGAKYRFRYNAISPEEGYSPIAGMALQSHSAELERKTSWHTHIDFDGAICSEAVCVPMAVKVHTPDGSHISIQVRLHVPPWSLLPQSPSTTSAFRCCVIPCTHARGSVSVRLIHMLAVAKAVSRCR